VPLIVVAYVVLAAALLAGFGGAVFFAGAIAAVTGAVAALRRDATVGALALLAGVGVALGGGWRAQDSACRDDALARHAVVVILRDDASPGTFAPATMDGTCAVRVALEVTRGRAQGGSRVQGIGEVVRQGDRLLVQRAAIREIRGPSFGMRLRIAAGRRIDAVFGEDAPLARALVLADERAIDRAVRSRYSDAGIVHMLSVSGLHVGIIAAAVELLFAVARMSRRRAALASLIATIAYVAMLGFPAPAVRSAVMLAVGTTSRVAQRPTSPWAALALGALLPLVDPRVVTNLGYQLSVLGMASLIASRSVAERLIAGRFDRWARGIAAELIVSAIATATSLPLIAWTFGRVSLVAPIANIAAAPLFGILQPLLFLALAVSWVPPLAYFIADAAHAVILAADRVSVIAAAIPFAAVDVAPSLATVVAMGVASVCGLVACVTRHPGRALVSGVASLSVAMWLPLLPDEAGFTEVHMIDVGQGDAVAVRTPRGRWIVIDAGRSWAGGDAGRQTVVPYLRRRGGSVAAFVLSHPHADHVGGAASVIRALPPERFLDGAYVEGNVPYRAALDAAAEGGVAWERVHPGDSLVVDGVALTVLAPDSAWTASLRDPNEASVVVRVRVGDVRFLMTGDAERGEEGWLLEHDPEGLRADVLKVGHHGSSTSTTPAFLDAVSPTLALVSVGAANSYGHPSNDVMARLVERGTHVLRTDQLGTILIRTDGRRIFVGSEGGEWEPFAASPKP
jgi:competence protein ComEC